MSVLKKEKFRFLEKTPISDSEVKKKEQNSDINSRIHGTNLMKPVGPILKILKDPNYNKMNNPPLSLSSNVLFVSSALLSFFA